MPPSQVAPLPSRRMPAEPPWVLKMSHGPLSEVKTTSVFSWSLCWWSVLMIWPTDQSISSMTSP